MSDQTPDARKAGRIARIKNDLVDSSALTRCPTRLMEIAMQQLTIQETEMIGGSGPVANFFWGKLATWVWDQVIAGNVDYASIAEQQGTYYNTVGA